MPESSASILLGSFLLGVGSILIAQKIRKELLNGVDDCRNLREDFPAPRRYGAAIQLKRDQYKRYRELHDAVWDAVLERMYKSNIRNFVIYYHPETSTMFQSFEWVGHWKVNRQRIGASVGKLRLTPEEEKKLFDRDMQAIADDPITRVWWKECEPCQEPFEWSKDYVLPSEGGKSGRWWASLECLCHTGHWPTSYTMQRLDPDFVKLSKNI